MSEILLRIVEGAGVALYRHDAGAGQSCCRRAETYSIMKGDMPEAMAVLDR